MTLQDIGAAILLSNGKCETLNEGRDIILREFKLAYPYWSFSEWNVEVADHRARIILKAFVYTDSLTTRDLIINLPAIANAFS